MAGALLGSPRFPLRLRRRSLLRTPRRR
ncbi:hypothetical protein LINPERHAP2_LOCUS14756 [Linum perenne]